MEDVLYGVDDGIATITLNRPAQRNALSVASAERLFDLWSEVDRDEQVRCVVLTSADCGTFCAGMDLKEAARVRQEQGRDILDLLRDPFYERMRSVEKPIIAAMTGHFTAGGMVLALNADLRIGMAGTRGGISEAKVGRGSPWGIPLLWMLPQGVVMEMVLTGELVSVERLHALGFVNHIEADAQAVRDRARTMAARIRDNAPLSVRAGKRGLMAAMSMGCDAGLAAARLTYREVYASADAQEGPRAFAEKRAPVWTGR
ncbi:enoyl-CoA hydratase/isomerase family protein [Hydrogenophaga sp.]|uniref:enoyl-CoA hydratase/isomerase family protein n=1 Tax=Hydrogenophaga sp. TaxID=1904254 RepID=UPI002718F819|nr:enoyl-CoA hydratase/isomerase family protein [Hydrogenophaga sp.]MDO9435757.1 enoyl-CoA hydratase/isomerase family protein [Hydrogenophaga sp.]